MNASAPIRYVVLPAHLEALAQAAREYRAAQQRHQLVNAACYEAPLLLSEAQLAAAPHDLRIHLQSVKSASQVALGLAAQHKDAAQVQLNRHLIALLQQYPLHFNLGCAEATMGTLTVSPQKVPSVQYKFEVQDFQALEVFQLLTEPGGPFRFVLQLKVAREGNQSIGLFEGTHESLSYMGGLTSFEDLAIGP